MIPASRFIVQSRYEQDWLAARKGFITATTVAKASTAAGFNALLAGERTFEGNEFTDYGHAAEPLILNHAHHQFGILHNDWLIVAENGRDAATPDGLSPDHTEIAEAKTTGTDWKTIPALYRRQMQWQLWVTGAERCLFLWDLRLVNDLGGFYAPWLEPKTVWVDRDDDEIAALRVVADR